METKNIINLTVITSAIVVFILLLAIRVFNIAIPISITTRTETSSELSVVGVGKVDVVPDTANVSAGITISNAATVDEAQSKINDVNNKIVSSLTALGIDKADIKTSDYSINPNYSYNNGQQTQQGFNATATVTIKVKKVDQLGQVVSNVTTAGANQVNNTTYSVENPEKYQEEARNMAIQNAKDQAQKLAGQLGIKLGKVTNIVESNPDTARPIAFGAGGVMDASINKAVTPNLEPGSNVITSTVTLFFEKD